MQYDESVRHGAGLRFGDKGLCCGVHLQCDVPQSGTDVRFKNGRLSGGSGRRGCRMQLGQLPIVGECCSTGLQLHDWPLRARCGLLDGELAT